MVIYLVGQLHDRVVNRLLGLGDRRRQEGRREVLRLVNVPDRVQL
jgi:hypothetical protein